MTEFRVFDKFPAPSGNRGGRARPIDWDGAKLEMMRNPGKWVLIAEDVASSMPQQIYRGRNPRFRGEERDKFRFRVRRPDDCQYPPRRSDIYGSYVGSGESPDA